MNPLLSHEEEDQLLNESNRKTRNLHSHKSPIAESLPTISNTFFNHRTPSETFYHPKSKKISKETLSLTKEDETQLLEPSVLSKTEKVSFCDLKSDSNHSSKCLDESKLLLSHVESSPRETRKSDTRTFCERDEADAFCFVSENELESSKKVAKLKDGPVQCMNELTLVTKKVESKRGPFSSCTENSKRSDDSLLDNEERKKSIESLYLESAISFDPNQCVGQEKAGLIGQKKMSNVYDNKTQIQIFGSNLSKKSNISSRKFLNGSCNPEEDGLLKYSQTMSGDFFEKKSPTSKSLRSELKQRSDSFVCDNDNEESGLCSSDNGKLETSNGCEGQNDKLIVKNHTRNNSCDGLLTHSRQNSASSSSVYSLSPSSSGSHSRHNSVDSTSLFSKNIFEWKTSSTSDLDSNCNTTNQSTNGRPKASSLFKWNLFSRPPCMDNFDTMSVHSNSSTTTTLSNPKDGASHESLVVSSTALIQQERPKELPAKSEAEKLKHEKEYLKILENIKRKEEQDAKLKKKQLETQLKNEEDMANAIKVWTQEILPNWETMRDARKTRSLWWKGVPSCVRSKVWYLAIGNELNISKPMYDCCMKDAEARTNDIYDNTIMQIRLDISRTFPHLCLFQVNGPYYNTLFYMLASYVCYNDNVYVQGMSYICAVFILNVSSAYEAFVCFCNFLHKSVFFIFYTLNIRMMQAYYATYNDLFKYNLPKLYKHFHSSGLTPDLYLLDWIYTLFTKAMNLDLVCKIWDLVMRDGEEFIFRTALGILHLNEEILMDMDFLQGSKFLTKLPDNLDCEKLFKSISQMRTSVQRRSYQTILKHHKSYV